MNSTRARRRAKLAAAGAALGIVLLSTACMGYPMEGAVQTPPPPGASGESRLPSLLSQLQGAGAGMEVFDGTQNEVLGAQDGDDAQGTPPNTSPTSTPTPPDGKVHTVETPIPTPVQTVAGVSTPRPNPTTEASIPTATPTPTGTPQQSEATPTPSPTPTNSPTPTATPTPNLPPSETGGGGGLPPAEGG